MKKKELENLLYQIKKKLNIIVIYNKEKEEYDIRCMEKNSTRKNKGGLNVRKRNREITNAK